MSILTRCKCGQSLVARDEFAGKRANCPSCGGVLQLPHKSESSASGDAQSEHDAHGAEPGARKFTEFLDPPADPIATSKQTKTPILRRMFEALLDPHSIQWMLILGGGLLVLGLIVLLINWLDIQTPFGVIGAMSTGSLVVLAGGWHVTLKTRFKIAGRALTFLGCVVAPLNLWYCHAQGIVTLENHLWVGGVVCSLLYIATVRVLRDPFFMYAVEAGVSLTVLLFLPVVNVGIDTTVLSIGLMAMGLISIHGERAFVQDNGEFTRKRYGMPLFWCGQVQVGASLLILLGAQILVWLSEPIIEMFGSGFRGNLLTDNLLLTGALWLVGAYVYLYCDLVVRRVGVYVYVAAFCLLMAIVTVIGGQFANPEAVIIALAVVALGANIVHCYVADPNEKWLRVAAPLGTILSGIPLLVGWILLINANNPFWGSDVPIQWIYVIAMLVVAISNRMSAHLFAQTSAAQVSIHLFFSAAGLLLAAAGFLPLVGAERWFQQAPLLMLIPIGYIIASRCWRGRQPERPLGWIAHAATGVILFHVLASSLYELVRDMATNDEQPHHLMLGLVFAQAAVLYALAGFFRKRSVNSYFAAAAACGALWQWMGYFEIASHYQTILYAALGVVMLVAARLLGLDEFTVYRTQGEKATAMRGKGRTVFQSGNAILSIALLSAFWQGVMRLFGGQIVWTDNVALLITTAVSVVAIWMVPKGTWRRVYVIASVMLAGLGVLTVGIDMLRTLTLAEQVELVSVVVGVALLIAGYIGRFRETEADQSDLVGVGLFLGSILATVPLLVAVVYYRWWVDTVSLQDEVGIIAITILMLVTGYGWQAKSPTVVGGCCLVLYVIVLIKELAGRAQEMVGIAVFMTIVGAVMFGIGIILSMHRERLLKLPDTITKREGVFRILTWR